MTLADRTVDVVVAGAGYSGLQTARTLVEAGLDVVVLEARDRVGGRVLTEVTPSGAVVDQGGQWIGPTQDRLQALADEYAVSTFPTYLDGSNLEVRDGWVHPFTGLVPTSDRDGSADTVATLLDLDLLAQEVSPTHPWDHPDAGALDRITLAEWVESAADTQTARSLVATAALAVFGCGPEELSLLYVLSYAHSGGSMSSLIRTAGGAQERRFTGGAQQMALRLAQHLADRIVLDAPVVSVSYGDGGAGEPAGVTVTAERMGADGVRSPWRVAAQRLVVAMPPAVQGRIAFDPPLPGSRQQLAQRAPMGSVTKVHAVYDQPFWRDAGLSGQVVADAGMLRAIFDDSPEDGSHGILMGFIAGAVDRSSESDGAAGRQRVCLEELARAFGPKAAEPIEFVEQRWSEEPYSRGGPVAGMGPGVLTACGPSLRTPVGPIHWAGTETASVWSGYIEGALESGERAAAEVVATLEGAALTGTAGLDESSRQ
ncbi:MAG: flavin monoamine oxidase family protein [Acidimicrobiales bacterium]